MSTKTTTTTMEASAEEIRSVQGIRDDNRGSSGSMTGPVDWKRQCSVDFIFCWVDNSNTVLYLYIFCLVLILFSPDYFFMFAARKTISTAIMQKIFLYQVYTNLAYAPPTYIVRDLDYTRLMRQGLTTNMLSWQGNFDYRKSAIDYANLWRAFRNYFSLKQCFPMFSEI